MTGLGIVFSILLYSGWTIDYVKIVIGFITGFLGSSAAMVINDVVDYRVDAINKPWKPIPSGIVDRVKASYLSIALLTTAIAINTLLGIYPLFTALVYGVLGYIYSFLRRYWWSHFIVAFSTTSPIIYGYVVAGSPKQYLVLAIMFSTTIYTATLGREIVKAIMDLEGDKRYGYNTLPLKYGIDNARKTILFTTITAPLLAYITGYLAQTSITYYLLITISITIYVYHMVSTIKNIHDKKLLEKTRRNTLYAMLIGLFAFLLSKT